MKHIDIGLFLRQSARALAVMLDQDIHLVLPTQRVAYIAKSELSGPLEDRLKVMHYKKANFLGGADRVRRDLVDYDVIKVYRHSLVELYLVKVHYALGDYSSADRITELPLPVPRTKKPALAPLQLEILLESYYKPISVPSRMGLYLKVYSQHAAAPAVLEAVERYVDMGLLYLGGPANSHWAVTDAGRAVVDRILESSHAVINRQQIKQGI